MKRKIFFIILCQLAAFTLFAQSIRVQKSQLVPPETTVFHANQAAALNTKTGQTLVVWQRLTSSTSNIMGRIVNVQGNPVGDAFQLNTTAAVAHPDVIYNPARNEFMVGYDDNPNTQLRVSNVILRRLNAQGRPAGDEFKVNTDAVSTTMANFFPKLAFNPNTNGYAVVWLREIVNGGQSTAGNNGMVGELISSSGAPSGTVAILFKTVQEGNRLWGPITMDVRFSPANKKLLVALVQVLSGTNGTQGNYSFGTLDPGLNGITDANFAKINNAPLQLTQGFTWGAKMALFNDVPGFVFFADSGNIKRRKIDLQGKLSGAQAVAFKAPKNNTRMVYPSVAFETNAKGTRGVLLATQDAFRESGQATIWAQVLNSDGLPIGAPLKVDTTSATDTAISGIVTPMTGKPKDTLFRFTSFYTLVAFTAPGQTFTNSGIVKLNLNVTVP